MHFTPQQKVLILAGAILFFLGLVQGGAVQLFHNPRMALSAHLTAVQSGMALMIAGVIWSLVLLGGLLAKAALWATVAGMYGLWVRLTLSAATGASETLPIAGQGYAAAPATEFIVSVLVLGSSGLMTVGWLLLSIGVFRSWCLKPNPGSSPG